MALLTSRRRSNPEGRMPLREHLTEFRQRLIKCAVAIAIGGVIGWFLAKPVLNALLEPLREAAKEHNKDIAANFSALTSAFSQRIRIAIYIGVVLASPVWIYQLWAFIVPGLTRREKRYAVGFVAVAVPLFLAGIGLAWFVLPNAVKFLTGFLVPGSTAFIDADSYLTFVTRLMLAFGIAMIIPLLLVALNMAGLVRARTLLRGWRIAVFLTFLFAAIASPTPDATSMLALAFPMVGLYMAAVGVAMMVDRRRARRLAADPIASLADDEAGPL